MTTIAPTTSPTSIPAAPAAVPVRTLGTVSLVLGIVSVASGLNAALGIAAIILAVLALRQEPASRGIALGGLITGIVSATTLLFGFALLAAIPFIGLLGFWGW